ncbi:ATP-binding protein [Sulfurirhabdus autotrophica]|uniref:histidine kinase n=1 Tax=Sulfurirhabdus autotrophica TaxID=1706046 RepID=A0A4R3YFG1_9PROT|nr:ATP-binding protein [Sulfurirhabdus autotrophica]TCV89654.1 signal transduction histidine kinase [Sulfurirhabdus autotrophica]
MAFDRMTKLSWIYDLYRLGQDVALRENTDAIYQQIIEHIVDGFEGKSGSLALRDAKGDNLTIVAGIDLPEGVVGSSVKLGGGVLGWVAQEGSPLLLNGDASNDVRFQRNREGRGAALTLSNSAICWPLKVQDRVIGAISVNRPNATPPFAETDMEQGTALLNMVSLALANMQLHVDQNRRIEELKQVNAKLAETQNQLLQSEKMASIGQLAAGVAHEINNPIGYVYSNLSTLEKYVQDVFSMVDAYEQSESAITDTNVRAQLQAKRKKLDMAFLKEDLRELMGESKDGITRVKQIVQNLKDFSHVDTSDEWHFSDLIKGIDSTLNIVNNEIKYKAKVIKEYGDIPEVECLSSQLNQVFMNLLVNAAHAIEEKGEIAIRTGKQGEEVWVEIADSGKGIAPGNLKRIFDPFFTTKPVGKGTGLGLSLSYGIIQKHHGRIEVQSEEGKGTAFKVWLPIRHVETHASPN